MRYKEVISGLIKSAKAEPNIRFTGYKNIYELNSIPTLDYDVFYITPNVFTGDEDTITYSLNLYYISRWDETENNQIQIQSSGITILQRILNRFVNNEDVTIEGNIVFHPFYQKFKDMTAGVFATVNLKTDNLVGCE